MSNTAKQRLVEDARNRGKNLDDVVFLDLQPYRITVTKLTEPDEIKAAFRSLAEEISQ